MNYSGLKKAARQWADRNDTEVDDNLDAMITFTEGVINRHVKVNQNSKRALLQTKTSELEQGYYRLPDDYNGMRVLRFNGCSIGYLPPEQMFSLTEYDDAKYTELADQLYIAGIGENDCIEMIYFQRVPGLSELTTTNWLLQHSPDIYLFGVMWFLEDFVKNYQVADTWKNKMYKAIDDLVGIEEENRYSGSTLQIRAE